MPKRDLLVKSPRYTTCVAKKIKLSNGCKRPLMTATTGCSAFWQIHYYAACATMLDTRTCSPKSVYPQRHDCKTFIVLRAKATQRFQGCTHLCRCRVAAD